MKIKQKKQFTLPQLIEWAMENKKFNMMFNSDKYNIVLVSENGTIKFTGSFYDDLFTVVIEEEITEDMVIEKLYHTTIPSRIVESGCSTIKSTLEHSTVEPIAFYILNDDLTMTLIWHDGKLVE